MSYLSSDGKTTRYIKIKGFRHGDGPPRTILYYVYRYSVSKENWLWDGNGRTEFGNVPFEINKYNYSNKINLKKEDLTIEQAQQAAKEAAAK